MSNRIPVLIVGAGPTGLMMAAELARHGVSFRIIDMNPSPTASSNATWIQTRTLEIFDHIGLAERLIKASNPCHAINLYLDGQSFINIPLKYIDSIYQYVLMLPQAETEKILNERLESFHYKVERSWKLIDIEESDHAVISTIRHADGRTETIMSDWVVGCDGSNSTVRQQCQIDFPGDDLTEQFIVADAEIESFMSKDEVHVFFDKETIFAAFPLGSNKYRITANLHLDHQRKLFTEREVIEMAQERAHGAYYVKSVSWISPFWIHSKTTKQMQSGSIFLAGDAAHVHSPVGGQGMNTGIQDAYNLAWKIALVVKMKAKESILESYHAERYPVINEVVTQTERYTKMILFDNNFSTKLRHLEERISTNPVQSARKFGNQLTQLGIQYNNSTIIDYENISGKSLHQGARAPDVAIDSSKRLYDYFRDTQHHILLFAGLTPRESKLAKLIEAQHLLNQLYPDLVKAQLVTKDKLSGVSPIILDSDGKLHEAFHAKNFVVYIIRPDTYIGYCSKSIDVDAIHEYLKRYLYG